MANDVTAFNTEAFSKQLIINLDRINVMMPLVNRDWEGDLKDVGDTVNVRTLGSITMSPYVKGVPITYEDLTPATEKLTVNDASHFAFQLEDIDATQSDVDILEKYSGRAAVSMSEEVERKLLSNYADAHVDNRITGAASAALALDETNIFSYIVEARKRLNKKNVPTIGRWMVIDPDTQALIEQSDMALSGGTDMNYFTFMTGQINTGGGDPMAALPGYLGRVAGFSLFGSNAVPEAAGAKYIQFGDKYAIAYAAQIAKVEQLRLQTQFADAVRGLLLHDTKVFNENSKRFGYIKAIAS